VETEPGKGSCFKIHLPRVAQRGPPAPDPAQREPSTAASPT
jgi:hypothetical protein